jgi:hypothetical protein
MRMLDLFCGRWGWSRAFAARGWYCAGVDLVVPPTIPYANCEFWQWDVLSLTECTIRSKKFDFICASPPCEQFSVHGMKHFHPNPPYPELGIKLFNHTREICEASGVPYVIENVRPAQQFVGNAVHHCGPFYLWGNAVPPLVHRGIQKGDGDAYWTRRKKMPKGERAAQAATIPPELANCVAEYAERILERKSP